MSVSEELKQSEWLQAEEVSFPDEASLAVKCQEAAAEDHKVGHLLGVKVSGSVGDGEPRPINSMAVEMLQQPSTKAEPFHLCPVGGKRTCQLCSQC